MNLKIYLIHFSFFLFSLNLFAAENYKTGDSLYVASIKNLNVREAPSLSSPVLGTLRYNTIITIDEDSLFTKPFQVSVTNLNSGFFTLKGHWVKIKSDSLSGYVFDGMLSSIEGIDLNLSSYNEDRYFTRLFGVPQQSTQNKQMILLGVKYDYVTELKTYPTKVIIKSISFDSCWACEYIFKDISFNEAYWLIQRMFYNPNPAADIIIEKIGLEIHLNFSSCT